MGSRAHFSYHLHTMRMLQATLGAALALTLAAPAGSARSRPSTPAESEHHHPAIDNPDSGADLIGKPAPAWTFDRWIRTRPLSLESLRGKVVLLRWWTEGCHFCAATLPQIEKLRSRHRGEDLVVIGVYHPKPPREVSDGHIVAVANRLGFKGPIAVDTQWTTLERY